MRAAIYARRSTDEHQAESLDVQRTNALAFIEAKGWTIAPEHIFLEDAVSRAEFKKRPALFALLVRARAGEFDVVVVRDESRIGGDTFRSGIVLQEILDSDLRLFYYFTNEEVVLDNAMNKFLVAARSFAAELEREKTAQRTREHLLLKAQRGLNVGGRVYGYDNIEIRDGTRRLRVEYRIDTTQAETIREIFERYAAGEGVRALAKDLNAREIPSPRAGGRGTGSWSPSVIGEIVRRERYRGQLVWGAEGKAYKGGTRIRVEHPECDWVRVQVDDLRIVPEHLWEGVRARIARNQKFRGQRSATGPRPRYLLTGFARCSECGGPIQVTNGKSGTQIIRVYMCSWHRDRGDAVCTNTVRRPVTAIDDAVVSWIKQHVLTEALIVETLREVRRRLDERAKSSHTEAPALEAELKKVNAEIGRLANGLALGDEKPHAVIKLLAEKERHALQLKNRVEALKAAPAAVRLELDTLEAEARQRIAQFSELLGRNPVEARKAMDALLEAPLVFTPVELPEGKRYKVEGPVATGNLFVTEQEPGLKLFATPTGPASIGRSWGLQKHRLCDKVRDLSDPRACRSAGNRFQLLRSCRRHTPVPWPGVARPKSSSDFDLAISSRYAVLTNAGPPCRANEQRCFQAPSLREAAGPHSGLRSRRRCPADAAGGAGERATRPRHDVRAGCGPLVLNSAVRSPCSTACSWRAFGDRRAQGTPRATSAAAVAVRHRDDPPAGRRGDRRVRCEHPVGSELAGSRTADRVVAFRRGPRHGVPLEGRSDVRVRRMGRARWRAHDAPRALGEREVQRSNRRCHDRLGWPEHRFDQRPARPHRFDDCGVSDAVR